MCACTDACTNFDMISFKSSSLTATFIFLQTAITSSLLTVPDLKIMFSRTCQYINLDNHSVLIKGEVQINFPYSGIPVLIFTRDWA